MGALSNRAGCRGWLEAQRQRLVDAIAEQQASMTLAVFADVVAQGEGFERTEAGNIVGWVDAAFGDGDGFVDFGIYDPNTHNSHAVNGKDHQFLLDFNVDGVILDIFNKKMFEQKVGVPTRRRK